MGSKTNISNSADHIRELIVHLAIYNRGQLVSLLRSYKIPVNNSADNRELMAAVYAGIGSNEAFRRALANLMSGVAATKLKLKGTLKVDEFVKGGANIKKGFANAVDDEEEDNDDAEGEVDGKFGNTGVGSFLNQLFSKDNVNKYIDTGLVLVKNKQQLQANQQQIEMAALQVEAKRLAGDSGPEKEKSKNNWILPVVIGSVVVVGLIITVIVVTRKK